MPDSFLRLDAEPLRVVWAEDDADTRNLVTLVLKQQFAVVAVPDGQAALEAVLAGPADVVLADVVMPRLDGLELLKALRADPRTADVPVILVSGRAGEDIKIEGLNEGADDYIAKPFNVRELLARVGAHAKMARFRRNGTAALRRSEERLRELNADLEQRVRDRTAELLQSERHAVFMAELAERRAEQLRALAAELMRAEQKERRRVALMLHEHIQQLLVAARIQLDVVQIGELTAERRAPFQKAQQIIGEAVEACRSLTVELSPPVLQEEGLVAALHWLAKQLQDRHGLTVELTLSEDVVEPPTKELRELLFLAIKELLTNVVKHADTNHARVSMDWVAPHRLRVEVCDEGRGFAYPSDAMPSASSGSWGLFNIRERVDYIGGEFVVESSPGRGTRAAITVSAEQVESPGAKV